MKPQLRACVVSLFLGAATATFAYKEVPPPEKIALPGPKSPAESLAAIRVPAGFEVKLAVAEPLVMDPVDVSWGPDGRMWVVEMGDYPLGEDSKGKPGGRVRVLESTRGDGVYDRSTLFADGLRYPNSVRPWRNGVLVVSVPEILFLEDTDGDGRADRRTVVFTGLTVGNPQHLANGLQWGLDGWLYLANGDSGGRLTSPQFPAAVDIGRRDFRIAPDRGALELLTGQTQAGRVRDDWGNWFGCNNSNPLWHYALEEPYLRRNPHLVPPNAIVSVATPPGAAPVFPISATLARFNDPHGLNHFTSACGLSVYRDDALGADVAGNIFVCEPVHNLVHREMVRPAGATFVGGRAETETTAEFLASADNWSRFVAARAGPDGALYFVDMYRLVIEHPTWIPDAWQKVLGDLRVGERAGRIYRVQRTGAAPRPMPRLDRADAAGLATALESPSGLVRDLAQQQLMWRNLVAAAPRLERIVADSARPEARAQALWSLQGLGRLTPALVRRALGDGHPGVRRQAVRLSEGFAGTQPDLLPAVLALAGDPDGGVQQQVAYTLGEWREPEAGVALARLLRESTDRFIRAAAMSSALPHAETMLAQLGASGRGDDPLLIEIASATENAKALASILRAIAAPRMPADAAGQLRALASLLDWLQRQNKTLRQLSGAGDPAMGEALGAVEGVFALARRVVGDATAPLATRLLALQVVGRGRSGQDGDFELVAGLLTPRSPVELQLAAVPALGRLNRATVPEHLLAGWAGYGPALRTAVLDALMSRAAWTQVLLDRAEADPTVLARIDAGRREALMQHQTPKLAERATAIFKAGVDRNRQVVIDRYLAAMPLLTGEPKRGAAVFAAACVACHKFGEVPGAAIGPDLGTVKDRSAGYLVTHILDPNRAVEEKYMLYSATLQDNRSLAGMLAGEAGNSITLRGLDGVDQAILRSELRMLVSSGRSLMPDGLEGAVNEQAMTDLVAFLAAGGAK